MLGISKFIVNHYILSLFVVVCLCGGSIYYFLLFKNNNLMNKNQFKKILVIGIDGMDPKLVNTMMGEGKLPNFKRLAEQGSQMELQTVVPPQSPIAWTTIATGVNAGKHNIFDFIRRNRTTYMPELGLFKSKNVLNTTRYTSIVKASPFWKQLNKYGIQSTVIHWPVTFPVDSFKGKILSGLGTPDIKGFLSGYTLYTEKNAKSSKDSNKIEHVKFSGQGVGETTLYGPRSSQGSEIIDIKVPLQIKKIDEQTIRLRSGNNEQELKVNEWTKWTETEFVINFFTKRSGIWKAYLESIKPFKMFVTTMQINPKNPIVDISYPHNYANEIAEKIGFYYTLGMAEETDGLIDGALSESGFSKQITEIEHERDQIFWQEFNNFQSKETGVLAFVYDSSDRLQHTHWIDKNLSENYTEKIEYDKKIEDYYIKKDELLKKVLDKIDNKTAVIVLSDHGFTSFERGFNVNTWLSNNKYLSLTRNITNDDDGALFKYVDWKKTKAYAVGFNSIYINQKGREKEGIVENKKELIEEIIKKLEGIIDSKTGKRVIYKVYKADDVWEGESLENAPDMILGYYPGYRADWKTAVGGFTTEEITDNNTLWTGDHMVDKKFVPGILFTNFKIKQKKADQVDIVPTVYDLLNIRSTGKLDGKSLIKE